MSRMAALVFLATLAASAPKPSNNGITAEQAMANYRAMVRGATSDPVAATRCPDRGNSDQIVVCRQDDRPGPRLPMPEARAEPGEVVHHLGEPPRGDPGPPRVPSKFGETMMKGIKLLKSAVTGEDPTD
jgi:hypothetical protein